MESADMLRAAFFSILAFSCLAGCSSTSVKPTDVSEPTAWGAANHVVRYENWYFSDQPDEVSLMAARLAGAEAVVSLREPGETAFDEARAARDIGIRFINVPIPTESPTLDPGAVARLNALATEYGERQVYFHCSSGNRAAAWFATWLVTERGLSEEEALAVAARAGLTNEEMVARVRTYLREVSPP
jgi:protein tyrosine phosphatase (PTP) superfamily phosphohydrolase (DUF442 family)